MNQFSRGQSLSTFDIQDRKVFDVIQEVGGSQLSRWVVVNATSIFSIEPLKEDKATSAAGATSPTPPPQQQQGTLRSQRSLLEIGRVTFLQHKSFTVHFKSSYGGDQVTYLYQEPMEVVKAIQDALGILGVKGKHTSSASGGGGGGSSALKQTRIQGGSFRERPRDAIRRLEDEMKVRPTLAIVRGIMDRYRRLIDACVSDPSHAAEKEAERLMHALQQFLMREDVERTLNSETQILHQRERSEEEIVVERERERSASLSRDRAASEAREEKEEEEEEEEEEEAKASLRPLSSFLVGKADGVVDGEEEERKNQENQEKKKKKEDNVDDGSNGRADPTQKQEQKQEKQNNQGSSSSKTAVMTSMGRGIMVDSREDGVRTVELDWAIMYCRDPSIITVLEDDSELSQVATATTTSNDDKERISDDELNLLMKDYEEGDTLTTKGKGEEDEESEESNIDFVGTPYKRSPGEVYLSQVPESQINHARVAEQGYFLGSGKVQTDYRYERTEEEERRLSGPGR